MTELVFREEREEDIEATLEMRGRTRENPVSRAYLTSLGITPESVAADFRSGNAKGWVCVDRRGVAGFSGADAARGEVVVVAVLPGYEGRGVGKRLLALAVGWLRSRGCGRVWLAANPDPAGRAHGFYRRLGWRPTGEMQHGDEILVLD